MAAATIQTAAPGAPGVSSIHGDPATRFFDSASAKAAIQADEFDRKLRSAAQETAA